MSPRSSLSLTGVLALAACLALLRPDPVTAETYQWTDKDGTVGFADSLEKVPPQYRKSAKRVDETGSGGMFQTVPRTPGSGPPTSIESSSSEDPYAAWRSRLDTARAELEELRAKRQKAQEEYESQRYGLFRWGFANPETEAKTSGKLKELDQQVRDKEYEINTTIPDEARRAGVPPGALAQ